MSVHDAIQPRSKRAWLLLALLVAMIALVFLPLRFALAMVNTGATGLSARSAGGTIWNGQLVEARIGTLDLGTINAGLRPQSLLLGRAQFDFEQAETGGLPLTGSAESGWGRRALYDVSGSFVGGQLDDLPVGQVALEQATVVFVNDRCTEASGRVRLVLAIQIAGVMLRNGLSGALRCADGALLLPLVGDSGIERLTLRINGDGRYRGTLGTSSGSGGIRIGGQL